MKYIIIVFVVLSLLIIMGCHDEEFEQIPIERLIPWDGVMLYKIDNKTAYMVKNEYIYIIKTRYRSNLYSEVKLGKYKDLIYMLEFNNYNNKMYEGLK